MAANLQKELDELRKERDELVRAVCDTMNKADRRMAEIHEALLRIEVGKIHEKLENEIQQSRENTAKIAELQQQLAHQTAVSGINMSEKQTAELQCQVLETRLVEAEANEKALSAPLDKSTGEKENLEQECQGLKAMLCDEEDKAKHAAELEAQLEQSRSEKTILDEECLDLKTRLAEAESKAEGVEKTNRELHQKWQEVKAQFEDEQKRTKELERQLKDHSEMVNRVERRAEMYKMGQERVREQFDAYVRVSELTQQRGLDELRAAKEREMSTESKDDAAEVNSPSEGQCTALGTGGWAPSDCLGQKNKNQNIVDVKSTDITSQPDDSQAVEPAHVAVLRDIYNDLVEKLDSQSVADRMFQSNALTLMELELIQSYGNRRCEAAQKLINILLKQPEEMYNCFLEALNGSNQTDVYEGLLAVASTVSIKCS